MFRVFAHAQDKKVPVVKNRSVSVEVDSDESTDDAVEDMISGIG
jgi:hypothetical protein